MHEDLDSYLARRRRPEPDADFDPEAIVRELKAQQRAARMPQVIRETRIEPSEPLFNGDALPDFLRLHAGAVRPDRAHPDALSAWRNGLSLAELRTRSGYSTSDFALALSGGMTTVMLQKFESQNTANQLFCRNLDVDNFHLQELPALAMGAPGEVTEDGELPGVKLEISASSADGQVKSYGGKLSFSKSLWSSHGETIVQAIQNYSAVFSSLEARLIAETLEAASPTTLTGCGLNLVGFNRAVEALMQTMNAAGQRCNFSPFGLLVPPQEYGTALALRASLGLPSLAVVANAYLTSDVTWYLFCNPATSAPLVRLRLRLGGVPRVMMSLRETETGPKFAIEHTIGFAYTNVCGVIECQ